MSEFYVYLPSNGCQSSFPSNTNSNYQIKLPQKLVLSESYEVGLSEITIIC